MSEPYLLVDVNCYECGKLSAFSNLTWYKKKGYCPSCAEIFIPSLERLVAEAEMEVGK